MEDENESISRLISPFELILNCDLPPPQSLFPRIDEPAAMPALVGLGDEKQCLQSYAAANNGGGDGKLELPRALQLSQTRAREAEERNAKAAAERDAVTNALIRESTGSSVYWQWVRVLKLEVLQLGESERKFQLRWFHT